MKRIFWVVISMAALFSLYWILFSPGGNSSYEDSITLYRHDRAEFYRNSPLSPFIEQHVPFSYLNYFPVNLDFKFEAEFNPSKHSTKLALATSTGGFDTLVVIGNATFKLQERTHSLLVLGSTNPNDSSLFIPFQDATSGHSTYGGGRYLEVPEPEGNRILLDFNKCYNPYCAYTEGYTCPFPPKENILKASIEAGEKVYQAHR